MRLDLERIKGAKILSFVVYDDVDASDVAADWNAYRIEVLTTRGMVTITGCHDQGPDVEVGDRVGDLSTSRGTDGEV